MRVAPLGELRVYEISEAELEKLESGPPGQLHLNFALAMLPAALTILITLQTIDVKPDRLYYTYLIAFGLLAIQGMVSLVRWFVSGGPRVQLIDEIRARMPETPGITEQLPSPLAEPEPGQAQPGGG